MMLHHWNQRDWRRFASNRQATIWKLKMKQLVCKWFCNCSVLIYIFYNSCYMHIKYFLIHSKYSIFKEFLLKIVWKQTKNYLLWFCFLICRLIWGNLKNSKHIEKSKKQQRFLLKTDVDVYKQHQFSQKPMLTCTHNISFYKIDVIVEHTTSIFTKSRCWLLENNIDF